MEDAHSSLPDRKKPVVLYNGTNDEVCAVLPTYEYHQTIGTIP